MSTLTWLEQSRVLQEMTLSSNASSSSKHLTCSNSVKSKQASLVEATRESYAVLFHSLPTHKLNSWMSQQQELTRSREEVSSRCWSTSKIHQSCWQLIEWMRLKLSATKLQSWSMVSSSVLAHLVTLSRNMEKVTRLCSLSTMAAWWTRLQLTMLSSREFPNVRKSNHQVMLPKQEARSKCSTRLNLSITWVSNSQLWSSVQSSKPLSTLRTRVWYLISKSLDLLLNMFSSISLNSNLVVVSSKTNRWWQTIRQLTLQILCLANKTRSRWFKIKTIRTTNNSLKSINSTSSHR